MKTSSFRLKSKRMFILIIFVLLSSFWPLRGYADGIYFIGQDEGGVYFQTDHDGGWYISREDLKYFKIGEKGAYRISSDRAAVRASNQKI
jgi:hypothetical protein